MSISLREHLISARKLPQNEALLRGRAQLLAEEDRILIETVLIAGQSAERVAKLAGTSGRVVRTRVFRLSRRIASRKFLDAARCLSYMNDQDARLTKMWLCQGLPQRVLCNRLGLSPHQLRRQLDLIRGQVASICRQRRSQGRWPAADGPAHSTPEV